MTFDELKYICEVHGLTLYYRYYQNSWVKHKVCRIDFQYDNITVFSYLIDNNRIQCIPFSPVYVEEWNRKVYLNKNFKQELFEKHLKDFIFAYKKYKIQDKIKNLESDFE